MIKTGLRIIMVCQDDLGDTLSEVKKDITPKERSEFIEKYSEHLGHKKFIFSNLTYGSWEGFLNDPTSDYLKGTNRSNNLD